MVLLVPKQMGNFQMVLSVLMQMGNFKMVLLVPKQREVFKMVLLVLKQMGNFQMVLLLPMQIGNFKMVLLVPKQVEAFNRVLKTDGEFLKNKEEECIHVHQVRAGSSCVQLKVGNMDINARFDSGAEITILSSTIYHRLKKAPAKVRDVDLQMADNDSVMKGFIIQPLQMKLGSQFFRERVYVASIGDDMLLGHDLLHHLGVCLDMRTDTLVFNEERIPVTTSFKDSRVTVARVSVEKRVKVPPNYLFGSSFMQVKHQTARRLFYRASGSAESIDAKNSLYC